MSFRPPWYPDWSGARCVIIASGPSASGAGVDRARGRAKVIATNNSWKLAPWADMLYASDAIWWTVNGGVPEFTGLKVSRHGGDPLPAGIRTVSVHQKTRAAEDDLIYAPGVIAGGGGSGYQSLNLAIQFGCKDIALVGLDATLAHGSHWHGDHGQGLKNPGDVTTEIWRDAMDRAGYSLAGSDIKVVNCSAVSTITAFPKTTLEDWLACSP